jgi:glutamate N-acetyltransferase/amino-acid N-acetyltransferase
MNGVQVCRDGGVGEDRGLVDLTPRHTTSSSTCTPGRRTATVWTNDLTHDYVHENSAYST